MDIIIKYNNKNIILSINNENITIKEIKDLIFTIKGIPQKNQQLYYNNNILRDTFYITNITTLELNITENIYDCFINFLIQYIY